MKDRYLCRAKRIDNEQWVEGFYFCMTHPDGRHTHHFIIPLGADLSLGTPIEKIQVEVDPSTICWCTGSKDKNGKLIWENDIIECKDGKHNFQTQIEWDAYCAGFIFQDTETSAVGLDAIATNGLHSESKVIGNIFDNKELVESEEN